MLIYLVLRNPVYQGGTNTIDALLSNGKEITNSSPDVWGTPPSGPITFDLGEVPAGQSIAFRAKNSSITPSPTWDTYRFSSFVPVADGASYLWDMAANSLIPYIPGGGTAPAPSGGFSLGMITSNPLYLAGAAVLAYMFLGGRRR